VPQDGAHLVGLDATMKPSTTVSALSSSAVGDMETSAAVTSKYPPNHCGPAVSAATASC
jgi:hypothetical protein